MTAVAGGRTARRIHSPEARIASFAKTAHCSLTESAEAHTTTHGSAAVADAASEHVVAA